MRRLTTLAITLILALSTTGCELIADIFQVGFWVGVILILLVVGVIGWMVRLFSGRGGGTRPPE